MKIASFILGAFIALFSVSAQAAFTPTPGFDRLDFVAVPNVKGVPAASVDMYDMENAAGDFAIRPFYEGIIDTRTLQGRHDFVAEGSLAANTTITFTYALSDAWTGPVAFEVAPSTSNNGFWDISTGINDTHTILTIVIANLQDALNLDFSAGILLAGFNGAVDTTYQTVSNVPLPAALPLFGLGLVGLAGYRARKKAA